MENKSAHEEFMDKCVARWHFESTGVKLYDEVLKKCPEEMRSKFQEIRDEEKQHEEILEKVIRKYGGDPRQVTPSARITQMESVGIVDVVNKEDFVGALNALLTAELVDNVHWELLVQLADKINDDEVRKDFELAMEHEEEHLQFIRHRVADLSLSRMTASAAA